MVNARLHIICGNCGSDKENLSYRVATNSNPEDSGFVRSVYLNCGNCGTIHVLSDNIGAEPCEEKLPDSSQPTEFTADMHHT